MSAERAAVEHLAELSANACARVLSTLSQLPSEASEFEVLDYTDELAELEYPLVSVNVSFIGEVAGDNLVLLTRAEAGNLARAMMQGMVPDDSELGAEIEDSAVCEAMNQMMGGASSAIADELAIDIDIEPPVVRIIESRADIAAEPEGCLLVRYRLTNERVSAQVLQIVPPEFARTLARAQGAADQMRDVVGAVGSLQALPESAAIAVERTARISAEAAAGVLSALLGADCEATLPAIESDVADPFATLSFPAVAVEVAYVSGVTGNNLFVLTPEQAAVLAAVMMGLDEPQGDGLSDIELSAVSEAMNQMMGAATNTMADTLSLDIEVAPPRCQVVNDLAEINALFDDCAFLARFRLLAERFKAEVVQLVSSDFARHLERAFAAADMGHDVVTGVASPQPAAAPPPVAASGGWDALAPAPPDDAIALLGDVRVRFSAELGRTRMPVGQAASLPLGSVVKLDRSPADPVDVLINGRHFAQARLVLVDGEYAVQIVELTPFELAA